MAKGYGFFDLIGDIFDATKQLGDELTEIVTDGAKEIFINDNKNYKTSYEKRDEADRLIGSATNKIENKAKEVHEYARVTEQIVIDHFKHKINISQKFLVESFTIVSSVKKFNLSVNLINERVLSKADSFAGASDPNYVTKFSNTNGPEIGDFFGGWINQSNRIAKANEYLDDAKEFRDKINFEMAQLENIRVRIQLIRNIISEEKSIFDGLLSNLNYVTKNLRDNISKEVFTNNEAEKITKLVNIADAIQNLLMTKFIGCEFEITGKYKAELASLKRLINDITFKGGM